MKHIEATQEQRNLILSAVGNFCWDFGSTFFVETKFGNFLWSDPDYNGDNSFKQVEETFEQFNQPVQTWRDKGVHSVSGYCGDRIEIWILKTGLKNSNLNENKE